MTMNLYVYGMSHSISVIERITGLKCQISHNSYVGNDDRELFVDHGVHAIEGMDLRLLSTIFHPDLIKAHRTPIGYLNAQRKLVQNDALKALLRSQLAPVDNMYSIGFVNGNEHHVQTLTRNRFDYDFIVPERPDLPLDRSKQIVALSQVRAAIASWSAGTYAIYQAMADLFTNNFYYADPPPPIENLARIIQYNEGFRGDANEYGVLGDAVRLKIYIIYCDELAANNEKFGYQRLKAPFSSLKHEFLPDDLAQGVTHGNIAYAGMVLADFLQKVSNAPI